MTTLLKIKTDALGRRSRFTRQPTGKRVVLSKRDIEIFCLLYRYRYLRADRILKWFAPCSENRLKERLGDLYHEGFYINRVDARWGRSNVGMLPFAYELTHKGMHALLAHEDFLLPPTPAVSHAKMPIREIRQFDHALAISHTMFDLELAFRDAANKRILFEHEILAKVSKKMNKTIAKTSLQVTLPPSPFMPKQKQPHTCQVVPDALFAIETTENEKSLYRFYALEVELTSPLIRKTPEQSSTLKKLFAYQHIINHGLARKQLSLPNLFVIFESDTLKKLEAIQSLSLKVWCEEERSRLLFKPIHEITPKWNEHFEG